MSVGIIGCGSMGSGIAQVAAQAGESVLVFDTNSEAILRAKTSLEAILSRLVQKERISAEDKEQILSRIEFVDSLKELSNCNLVIEAIVEKIEVKQSVFELLEKIVDTDCVLATNTSSLSIASLAKGRLHPERIIGLHFFNPAPLMPLVELIPSLLSNPSIVESVRSRVAAWNKTVVVAKDTPGFIVNRVARPFYGEALKMYEEGLASFQEIDQAMRDYGGFRMGPFQLMDLIGNDINYAVTTTVWTQFYYDPRFKPSLTQCRMSEAGLLGRKSGQGYYSYPIKETESVPLDEAKAKMLFERIFFMLVNEAYDALFMQVASAKDIDLAMQKGVNYPKGLIAWGNEYGLPAILTGLELLFEEYGDDRYRPNPLLRRTAKAI